MREETFRFGASGRLVGVSTEGAQRARGAPGVVFLTAGIVHRVGPGRFYLRLARKLAEAGFACLRFDLSGIGDSGPRQDALPYAESSAAEAREAMDRLNLIAGVDRFVLIGLCSGTLTAFRTACSDERVIGLVLLSALLEDPATIGDDVVSATLNQKIAHSYSTRKIRDPRSWLKLLSGRANYANIARVALSRLGRVFARRAPPTAGVVDVIEKLDHLFRRGLEALVIFSDGTGVREYFRSTLEEPLSRASRRERIQVVTLPEADHNFTTIKSQDVVIALVSDWLQSLAR